MSYIIEELFLYGMHPLEEIVTRDEETAALQRLLPAEELGRLDTLESLYLQRGTIYASQCYAHGFRLGALLTAEVFPDKE